MRESTELRLSEQLIKKIIRIGAKPLRTCKSLHECFHCHSEIRLWQKYFDGGYGSRLHETCYVMAANAVKTQLSA